MFATQTSIARQFQITNTGTQTIQVSASVYPSFDAGVAKGNVAFIHMLSATQAAAIAAVLTGTGLLQSVTSINILTDLPTLGQLIQYDAALVGGVDGPYAASLGSRLVDYVDQGGGLVLIGGALRNDQCLPGNLNVWNPACASWVSNITETLSIGYSDLLHPAMRGVSTFVRPRDGKSALTSGSVFGDVAYTDYPYLLVEMGSGLPTLGEDFPRLDLNFDPVFTECEGACGWDPATDGARLMANALRLTMGRQILRSGPSVAIGPGKTATPTITLYARRPFSRAGRRSPLEMCMWASPSPTRPTSKIAGRRPSTSTPSPSRCRMSGLSSIALGMYCATRRPRVFCAHGRAAHSA
jgi:hypothetical protein